jgi:predicted amidohydrolase YtcJ
MGELLVRGARLVPVGGVPAPPGPVDLLVRGGVVAAVAEQLPDTGVPVVEADGRWLVPGLWDHHVHMTQWSRTLGRLDLAGTTSPQEVLQRVAEEIRRSRGAVVVGYGYRSAMWHEAPTVAALDSVAGDRPVVLISGDAHNGWLSSSALRLLGAPSTQGTLTEYEWFDVLARLDDLPRDEAADRAGLTTAVSRASMLGVVGITDFEFGRCWDEWPQHFADGLRSLRVRAATYAGSLDDVVARGLRTGDALEHGDGLLTMGPLKVISDGSLNTRTAYCCAPYVDSPGGRGALNVSAEELTGLLGRAHAHGLRAAVHAIGDAAVSTALAAFASTGARGTIEHAQLVVRADLARMAQAGVTASVQPGHLLDDREVTERCWPDRADRCFAFRSMLDAGVRARFGSDALVSPLAPWLAMAAAVHRSTDGRLPWNPDESVSPAQALAASTDGQCTVGVGSPGDLVLLDADPLAPPGSTAEAAPSLNRLRSAVALTVVAGRPTYDGR